MDTPMTKPELDKLSKNDGNVMALFLFVKTDKVKSYVTYKHPDFDMIQKSLKDQKVLSEIYGVTKTKTFVEEWIRDKLPNRKKSVSMMLGDAVNLANKNGQTTTGGGRKSRVLTGARGGKYVLLPSGRRKYV